VAAQDFKRPKAETTMEDHQLMIYDEYVCVTEDHQFTVYDD